MIVTREMLQRLVDCVEAAVNYAEAETVPKGLPLTEMRKVLTISKLRMGDRT